MRANEPALLYRPVRRTGFGVNQPRPQGRKIRLAIFVRCNRVISMVDVVAEFGVVEVIELGKPGKRNAADGDAQAAYRVPNAHKMQVGIARELRAKRKRFDRRRMAIVAI
ncbi:hypothetical protein D3C71_1837950 [compost metagenome]